MTSARNAEQLYTPQILSLAVELAKVPFDPSSPLNGSARSQSCGSTVELSLYLDRHAAIDTVGLKVAACAIGQASAAIFARHATGNRSDDIERALEAIRSWLADEGEMPHWPDFHFLAAARDYPGRHGAILLPWKAAAEALSKDRDRR
ncbi:iron-sulfur cluster assembly scaffold protein [Parerythrobacter aestuarii]|uniref:iron-sulfur cluster assembly scaffold protein n=1 Tax=Parerythrobacter aestuarii TaxID=3020909 RepID=UPI0024DE1D0D|nr:iron-sulfur cluster assembly scaffold protein [Parerythrobacter aestuarii]